MSAKPFVHLQVHSEYSLLEAYSPIAVLVQRAVELEMPALALTDSGSLYGAIEFYQACRASGIRPILGCELCLELEERSQGEGKERPSKRKGRLASPPGNESQEVAQLTLLARNAVGYQNLLKVVTKAHLSSAGSPPQAQLSFLRQHAEGLIAVSAGPRGAVSRLILGEDFPGATRLARTLREIFGKESFYLGLTDHGLPEEAKLRERLRELGWELRIPLLVTNDVYYVRPEDAEVHEILLSIRAGAKFAEPTRPRLPTGEFYLKSAEEMEELFAGDREALETTLRVAQECELALELGKNRFPDYVPPVPVAPEEFLRRLCQEGLRERYGSSSPSDPRVRSRLEEELAIIQRLGFVSYFLIVWDFIHFARQQGIPVGPGRGSAAGSLVAYLLGITDVDPLRYGLFFERFLNPERVSLPDIDIDFCYNRREEVIRYVRQRYGEGSVAQIITFATLGARMAVRDVARVLGLSYGQADRLAKLIPAEPQMTLERALEQSAELRSLAREEPFRAVIEYARKLEGLPRQPGVHAAGVVIAPGALDQFVPLTRDEQGAVITQWSMNALELVGLLKMDFLGLKTLTVIEDCVQRIRKETGNPNWRIEEIPTDDAETFCLLSQGKTVGVFQLESPGMRDLCRKLKPSSLEDVVALVALYRPGPMENITAYAERKLGLREVEYDHPLLEPILKETYGVMIYQEQVMQAAHVLAGYSLGQADILRRAMGKKKPEEMRAQKSLFVEGCRRLHGIPTERAERIFDQLERFAGYGFNKAHSVCYGILAYRTAYLKAHFPAIFFACSLSNEIGDTERLAELVQEARSMGVKVLPPDVNQSHVYCIVEQGHIRYGLAAVKNVGVAATEALVRERERGGPFASLEDMCRRIPEAAGWNRKLLESLIRAGACDRWGIPRASLCERIPSALGIAATAAQERNTDQGFLFKDSLLPHTGESQARGEADLVRTSSDEELQWEKELLGFYWSGHPIQEHAAKLEALGLLPLARLAEVEEGKTVCLGGVVISCEVRLASRDRKPYARLVLEDEGGSAEVMVFPELYRQRREGLAEGKVLVAVGTAVRRGQREGLWAKEVLPLEDALDQWVQSIVVVVRDVEDKGVLERLAEIALRHPGKARLVLACLQPSLGRCVLLEASPAAFRVSAGRGFEKELVEGMGLPWPRYWASLPGMEPRVSLQECWAAWIAPKGSRPN